MPSKEEADRILNTRRKRKACYPCASRKVKCNGVWPCSTCVQRGHPEICIVERGRQRAPRRHGLAGGVPTHSVSSSAESTQNSARPERTSEPSNHEDASLLHDQDRQSEPYNPPSVGSFHRARQEEQEEPTPSFVGANAAPSFVHGSSFPGDNELEREVRPALGLQNTLKSYPFIQVDSSENILKEVDQLIPSHADVLKYSQSFQNVVYPFNPLVADKDDLEALICFYLELTSVRESSDTSVLEDEDRRLDVAQTSFLLAILASGVQFSDLPSISRVQLSREFTRRSFHCARLANFLLRPNVYTIQALLIIGHVLQNDGQADAAWTLVGSTSRLAQSLGFHLPSPSGTPRPRQDERQRLWSAILWQDSLLSISFDRAPISVGRKPGISIDESGRGDYVSCMATLVDIGRTYIENSHAERATLGVALSYLGLMDQLRRLRDSHVGTPSARPSRKERMEQHALDLHINFSISVICRSFLKRAPPAGRDGIDHEMLTSRAKLSFVAIMQAFLDLQSLTIVPLRTWSMIHAGLSSALLLELFGPPSQQPQSPQNKQASIARDVQLRFIKVLSNERRPASDSSIDSDNQPWLSASHLKALRALKNSISRRRSQTVGQGSQLPDAQFGNVGVDVSQGRSLGSTSEVSTVAFDQQTTLNSQAGPNQEYQLDGGLMQGIEQLGNAAFDNFGNMNWGSGYFENEFGLDTGVDQLLWGL